MHTESREREKRERKDKMMNKTSLFCDRAYRTVMSEHFHLQGQYRADLKVTVLKNNNNRSLKAALKK